jgi:hypothetical protein
MRSGYMICTVTCGNGVPIGMESIQKNPKLSPKAPPRVTLVFFGGDPGIISQVICARLNGQALNLNSLSATLGCGWYSRCRSIDLFFLFSMDPQKFDAPRGACPSGRRAAARAFTGSIVWLNDLSWALSPRLMIWPCGWFRRSTVFPVSASSRWATGLSFIASELWWRSVNRASRRCDWSITP